MKEWSDLAIPLRFQPDGMIQHRFRTFDIWVEFKGLMGRFFWIIKVDPANQCKSQVVMADDGFRVQLD